MPSTFIWSTRALIAALLCSGVYAAIIESPENQAVLVNTIAVMKCKTNNTQKPLLWAAFDGGSGPVSIYDGDKVNPVYQSFCNVTANAGRYDLHVKATPRMALKFVCIEPGDEQIERTAELIVIESGPKCFENVTFPNVNSTHVDDVILTCVVNYAGNWAPTISWVAFSKQEPLTLPKSVDTIITSKSVTSVLHVSHDSIKETRLHECRTKFTLESYKGNATARNVPKYSGTCQLKYDFEPQGSDKVNTSHVDSAQVSNVTLICAGKHFRKYALTITGLESSQNKQLKDIEHFSSTYPFKNVTSKLHVSLYDLVTKKSFVCQIHFSQESDKGVRTARQVLDDYDADLPRLEPPSMKISSPDDAQKPTCDSTDPPANDSTWSIVGYVLISVIVVQNGAIGAYFVSIKIKGKHGGSSKTDDSQKPISSSKVKAADAA